MNRTMSKLDPGSTTGEHLHVAVVAGMRHVLHVAVGTCPDALERQVAEYVARQACDQLYAADAECVHRLLNAGMAAAAVDHYFSTVGRRWDAERLSIHTLPLAPEAL